MQQHYHQGLVLVSLVVAILASYTALTLALRIRVDPWWVAVSVIVAIAASFAALGIAFTQPEGAAWRRYRTALGAVGMGVAITGMHYAGMFAAKFPADAQAAATVVNKAWLAG